MAPYVFTNGSRFLAQAKPSTRTIAKMLIANKDARETCYWLRRLESSQVVPAERLTDITDDSNQLIAILTTSVKRSRENQS